ncbi:CPBP family intramembrane glutamic endopeptidase [Natronoglycomyces albus]|uniref:CPBP family intramembrane metalloprotease n=1 Tax=Natronoglycomyces albus TaxID=2811108 RepID=A0A895XWG8_9ACTN|nr:CPBP family intramembrane glutamic endopeptidase [Natronoglycomyces albus]QSB06866.1 CPBP family intramembrane metalloprotease [Natronoglycomyces albus]
MNAEVWTHLVIVTAAATAWLAVYRLPFHSHRTRKRVKLAVSTHTGLEARYVFPILGTLIYLAAGIAAIAVVVATSGPGWLDMLAWNMTLHSVALTGFAMVGAACLTGFLMSMVYAIRPQVDIPGAVNNVVWIREVMALPVQWRWAVPMSSAAVEELFFRGVVLVGLLAADAPIWFAVLASGLIFTAGQVILTENPLQALVLTLASVVLSVVGGLLVIITGSVLPAILVHAAFAGFYTNNSPQQARQSQYSPVQR